MSGGGVENGPTVEGDLAKTPLGHVLIYCLGKRLTGSFVVYPDPRESGDPNARAIIMVRGGMIVATQSTGSTGSTGGTEDTEDTQLARTVLEALAPLCAQTGGAYAFYSGQDRLDPDQATVQGTADPRAVVAHALRNHYPSTVIDSALAGLEGQYIAESADADYHAYGLRPEELAWTRHLGKPVPVDGLLRGAGLLPDQARRMLYLLRITKAIALAAAPVAAATTTPDDGPDGEASDFEPTSQVVPVESLVPPPNLPEPLAKCWKEILGRHHRLEHDDCFQVLGLPRHANSKAAEVAFLKLSRQWSPQRLPPELAPMLPRAKAVFGRMRAAHRTLSDPFRRIEYLADLDAGGGTPSKRHGLGSVRSGVGHLREARRKLREQDLDAALAHAHLAVAADDTNPEAIALYSYLRFEIGERQPQFVDEALANLGLALEINPRCPAAHRFSGLILEHAQRRGEALAHYEQAMREDADDVHSASRWRDLAEAAERESQATLQDRASSIVGKLFSKLG